MSQSELEQRTLPGAAGPAAPELADVNTSQDRRPIRVAIVDDHDVVHAGIEAWCRSAEPPIELAGSYTSPDELDPADLADIDVVIADLQFQEGRPDPDIVRQLSTAGHRVVVYTMSTDTAIVLTCLDLGASCFLTKAEGRMHLVAAIHAAAANTAYLGPTMAGAIADDRRDERPVLSPREQEVLLHWFRTESKQLVAAALFITPATVNTHLARVRTKYAAAGRPATTKAALIARALQDGLVTLDEL
jgi:two-component system nitrate/nitrite response regulator NarL